MRHGMKQGHNDSAPSTINPSRAMHQERSKGFSLAEAMVLLTIFCMVFILGLQWYLNRPTNQTSGFGSGLKVLFGNPSSIATAQPISEGTLDDSQSSVTNPNAGKDGILINDDAIAAGVPVFSTEQNGLVLQFGKETAGLSLLVPGRVIVSRMPVGATDEMADIHWFFPE